MKRFVRMFIFIKSRPELKMGHVGSKARSLGQFLGKPCGDSRGQSFGPVLWNFVRMLILIKSRPEFKKRSIWIKNRLLGQMLIRPFVHWRGQF